MSWYTEKAMEELVRGRGLTNQLRDLLTKSLADDEAGLTEDLVIKIRNTFANTLSILRNTTADYYNDHNNEVSHKPRIKNNNNSSCDGRKSEDSGGCIKSTPPTLKDRKGSYRRRKYAESSKKITSALIDDGYAWRKYGQKQILNANHPRSYFRCTHKSDQGCPATKQVQKIEDDPPKYETIYYDRHTCKNMLKASQFILDHSTSNDSSLLLSFANNNLSNKQDNPFLSSIKQGSKEDYRPISEITTYNGSSSSEYLLSPHDHLTTFDPSAQKTVLSADHEVSRGSLLC